MNIIEARYRIKNNDIKIFKKTKSPKSHILDFGFTKKPARNLIVVMQAGAATTVNNHSTFF